VIYCSLLFLEKTGDIDVKNGLLLVPVLY